ncbi:MAG TPA: hypothetical protein VIC60_06275 [Thermomicrobiales bacterium]|jgi:uncharacterized membrane protein
MLENMAGMVGFAMNEDRLAQAAKQMRLAEAEQGRRAPAGAAQRGYRVGIAAALVALATRIAPAVTRSGARIQAITR